MAEQLIFNILEKHVCTDIIRVIIDYLKTYQLLEWIDIEKLDWYGLSLNPAVAAIDMLKANPDKIIWYNLSRNPAAIDLLQANPDKTIWSEVLRNPAKTAIDLLKANPDKIWWSSSPNLAIAQFELFIAQFDDIGWDWDYVHHILAVITFDLIKTNPDKIDWHYLSSNPTAVAIDILKTNPDKIDWKMLSENPAIFELKV